MCRVAVFDEVRLRLTSGAIRLECRAADIPAGESNLAYRAAQAFYREWGRTGGVEIRLRKRIPAAAGLGGGSSNAASVLIGLNHLYGKPFTRRRLMAIGRSLGADVPFFIFQAPALASGIGDRLEPYPDVPPYRAVLVCPAIPVSTPTVFREFNLRLTNCSKKITKGRLKKEKYTPAMHGCNDLETVTLGRHPELAALKHRLLRLGAEGALMSGSGPTVFGLFMAPAAAERAAAAMRAGPGGRVFSADLLRGPFELISEARAPGGSLEAG
jgi:4-diphosphocytidyl-2-C-methyl-D-erythritol kinase